MNALADALANGQPHAIQNGSVSRTVDAKRSEVKGSDLTSPDLILSGARCASWRLVTKGVVDRDGMMALRARWSA